MTLTKETRCGDLYVSSSRTERHSGNEQILIEVSLIIEKAEFQSQTFNLLTTLRRTEKSIFLKMHLMKAEHANDIYQKLLKCFKCNVH